MKIKDILAVSILLAVFIIAVFSYPYIVYWIHSEESKITFKAIIILLIVVAAIGLCAANSNFVYQQWKEREWREDVADKVHARKNTITMPEMKRNAESLLTDDEKAQMIKLHPEYRRTGEYTPQMFGAKIDTKV